MAYIKPAVQVYQELAAAGGAAASSPNMPACIVGPLQTVMNVDLTDSISKLESIGSTSGTEQLDAKYSATPADGELHLNFKSAKPGQVVDVDTISVVAEKPLVKTYSFVAGDTAAAGSPIAIKTNTIGNTEANADTPLPFSPIFNHIGLGDTVTVDDGSDIKATYVSAVDYTAGTILLNDSALDITATDVITIYRKFGSLTVGDFSIDETLGVISFSETNTLEASADPLLEGYTLHPEVEIEGAGDEMALYVGYRASRSDLSGRIVAITGTADLADQLGEVASSNPLAYATSIALANSGGNLVYAIATDPRLSERDAHVQATELAQAQRLYNLVPLTTEASIHASYKVHVESMSTPASGNWRSVMINSELPEEDYLYGKPGSADGDDLDNIPDLLVKVDVQGTVVTLPRGESAVDVYPGDYLKAIVLDVSGEPTDSYLVSSAIESNSGSTIVLTADTWTNEDGSPATSPSGVAHIYAARPATRQGQAEWVAAQAATWNSNRVWMFPGEVTIPNADGLDEVLPGYYLLAGLAGFISGTPAQQPITNIAIAGISDLLHGNFYFTEAQMNLMAAQGTLLYSQNAQGTVPYCRHGLTTDVSVLEYREILKVKNWDYLSYYYKDLVDPFIGSWNITPDTIQTIRQTLISASEVLLTRKLPKIGAPLLSYEVTRLEQSTASADAIDAVIAAAIVNPNNYTNLYLQL